MAMPLLLAAIAYLTQPITFDEDSDPPRHR
jgi:hypothetical protein